MRGVSRRIVPSLVVVCIVGLGRDRTEAAPGAPTGLVAVGEAGQIRLEWDDSSDPDLSRYRVYRSTLQGGPYSALEGATVLVPARSSWAYDDTGTDLGTVWRETGFDDSAWASGPAPLGYGDGDEATLLYYGPDPANKYPAYYFRRTFTVGDPSLYAEVKLALQRDDGAVLYLNGTEVARDNMPAGAVTFDTLALSATGGDDERRYHTFVLSPGSLIAGTNLIAVEVHQSSPTSSDISFDLELRGLAGVRSELLQSLSVTARTHDKPQSKLWRHAARWWGVFCDASGTWVWRLDGAVWTPVHRVSTATTARADCVALGNVTHILLYEGTTSEIASVEYVPGNPGTYQAWAARAGPAAVGLSSGVESATIDVDSTGRMWLASDSLTDIEVRYSDPPYTSFSGPVILASGVSTDDISVVTALPDGTVGVLWSNQVTQRFGFRVHADGDQPTAWGADEVPASASALNVGLGMADDHLNLAVSSDGTLYAAVKTSYDTAGYPKIALLVRRPGGTWDPLYGVDEAGTRPIVVLSEEAGLVRVVYTSSEGYNDIVRKDSFTESISFGARTSLLAGGLNDVTSTKQNFADDLALVASSSSAVQGILFSTAGAAVTASEFVDRSVAAGQTYYYVVTAENTAGEESAPSEEASAAPASTTPPAAPSSLEASLVSLAEVDLDWSDQSLDEDGFAVERSLDGALWSEVAQVGENVVHYSDAGLVPETTYFYRVLAFNAAGASAPSNVATITTSLVARAEAVNVHAGLLSGSVEDTWASDGVSEQISETATGGKGVAGLVVDHVLGLPVSPQEVTGLRLRFEGSWSALDGGEVLRSEAWNFRTQGWTDLGWNVGSEPGAFETDLSAAPADYIGTQGEIVVRFSDSAGLQKEKKDTLSVDFLGGLLEIGPPVPPQPPEALEAAPGDAIVYLSWQASPDGDVVDYVVQRDGVPVGSTGSETAFTDSSVANGVTYAYSVVAVDAGGLESAPSSPVTATPAASYPPSRPGDVSATAGAGHVKVEWTGNPEPRVLSYRVYRSTSTPVAVDAGGLLGEVSHLGSGVVHELIDNDVEVTETTTFYYVVVAVDADGDTSSPSAEVSATVTVVSAEELVILTAEYAVKPSKLTVVATSTLGGTVVLSLYGGSDEAGIDWSTPIDDALSYDPATGQHSTRVRTHSPPSWVGVASTGGGTRATAAVTVK